MSLSEYPAELIFNVGTLNVGDMAEHLPLRAVNAVAELGRMQMGIVGLQEVTAEHVAAIDRSLPNHKKHIGKVYGHDESWLMTLVDQDVFAASESHSPNGQLADSQLLVTELTSHDGQEVIFITRHDPQEVYKELHRLRDMMRLAKYLVKNYPNKPVVIAGDTNSTKAAPLNLITRLAGYRSAHKVAHGKEPKRTYPSKYGDELIKSGLDGKPYELIASRALRRAGNVLRRVGVLEEDGWDSPHAGCDIDRVSVNEHVEVVDAGIFADDRLEGVGPISDHLGVSAQIRVRKSI